jgi:hypothetical protein
MISPPRWPGLNNCRDHLRAAHHYTIQATPQLSGARHSRAIELTDKVADAIAFCEWLCFVVEADLRIRRVRLSQCCQSWLPAISARSRHLCRAWEPLC